MEKDLKQGLLAAYRQLLKPLVRILIRNGVAYGEFAEVAKEVYIDVASNDFKVAHRKMSQARMAILTGLTRKEVARLLSGEKKNGEELQSHHNRVTRVLTGWHTDADFTGPYGLPLEMQFEGETGQPSISELVHRYSGDMAARAMLDELVRLGVAIETEPGWYKILRRDYAPSGDNPDLLYRLATVVYNFINTVDFNFSSTNESEKFFERYVFADNGIRPEDLPRFQAYARERSQLLLEEIDNWLSQLEEPKPSDTDVVHTGLGIYEYIEDPDNKN